ncbi:MAG TPA: helix-turn-helix transcriptional regulator [Puia sp.]|nr:helix-turn-helix transcriptional regulator [Puia sp.]
MNHIKDHLFIVKIGLLTGGVIVLFDAINLFVIYKHIKLDYYLSLIALTFLITGVLIGKKNGQPVKPEQDISNLLTTKEVQILQLIAEGKTNKEIAGVYFIELSTVKTHINNIYSKLYLSNRKEARIKYEEMSKKTSIT